MTPDRGSSLCPVELRWEPSDVPLTIVVRRGRALRGVVVDEAGHPVRGAYVRVRDSGRVVFSASDGDGRFDAGVVLGEELAVCAWHDFNDREEADWTPVDDPDRELRVVLASSPSLEVDVPAEARGRDLVWVDEAQFDDDLSFYEYQWSEGGSDRFRTTPVPSVGPVVLAPVDPASRYTLWMPMPGRDEYLLATGVRGDAGHVSLALTKGATLSGRIVSKHEIVRVMAVRRGLRVVTRVDAANRFALRGLPPGAWRLFVEADEVAVPFGVRTGEPLELEVDLEDW